MRTLFARCATAVLMWGGVAGVVEPVTAQALPVPVPLGSWPGCPPDHPEGPCHWCPGDLPVQTGLSDRLVPGPRRSRRASQTLW